MTGLPLGDESWGVDKEEDVTSDTEVGRQVLRLERQRAELRGSGILIGGKATPVTMAGVVRLKRTEGLCLFAGAK